MMISMDSSPYTTDNGSTWASLRRVHFYVNDLIVRDLDRIGVSVLDRRVLDALEFAEERGADDGIPVATMCDLISPKPKPQTVGSALDRMSSMGWVEAHSRSTGGRRGRRWRLLPVGHEVRSAYKSIAETTLQEIYSGATERQQETLLAHGLSAMKFMDDELGPVVDSQEPAAWVDAKRAPTWAALRGSHFFLNDVILNRAQRLGVDVIERRILDSLGFAQHRGLSDGISIATICALVPPPMRPQTASAILDRIKALGWVDLHRADSLWRLTDKGQGIRADYKAFAEQQLELVYGQTRTKGELRTAELLELAYSAERHRNARLEPILRFGQF